MNKKAKSPVTSMAYVEWYAISIYWIFALVAVVLIGTGYYIYIKWLKPTQGQESSLSEVPKVMEKAIFAQLDGKVEVKKQTEFIYKTADYRLRLENGDFIRTGADGTAAIQCPDGTRLEVPPDSLVRVECQADTNIANIAELQRGSMQAEISDNRKEGVIRAPNETEITVGKRGVVHIRYEEETSTTAVEMWKGMGSVARGGDVLNIQKGEGAKVTPEGPIEKATLPDAPRLIQPEARYQAPLQPGDVTSIALEWTGVSNADHYEVYIANSPDLLRSRKYKLQATSVMLDILNRNKGRWFYWRVRAVDDKGFFSPLSETRSFTIVEKTVTSSMECPFQIDRYELFGSLVSIQGKTTPTCTVIFAGTPVTIQENGSFRHIYTIKHPGLTEEDISVENLFGAVQHWTMSVNVGDTIDIKFRKRGG